MGAEGGAANAGNFGQSDDPELEMAIRLSLEESKAHQAQVEKASEAPAQNNQDQGAPKPAQGTATAKPEESKNEEEELLRRAKEISMPPQTQMVEEPPKQAPQAATNSVFEDEEFINNLLKEVPDLDRNSPEIQALLAEFKRKKEEDQKKDENKGPEAK
eukprot:TRINITY_DN2391_c0_g2_i3.p2 TRINITY_DN2391_c0_g2~~TRINITY_DN2391_c0_g2_i3.p2  ORF type:complete len:159 (-),score=72.28 TRINITY_DN2391_c0_g2_i3:964-1440(-)